jgi:hypothetical protein
MMKLVLAALLAGALCAATTGASALEVRCAKHSMMLNLLTKKYSEKQVATGTVNEDRLMQLFVSPKGSWTLLMTKTDGEACIVAAGQNWEALPNLAEAEPAA